MSKQVNCYSCNKEIEHEKNKQWRIGVPDEFHWICWDKFNMCDKCSKKGDSNTKLITYSLMISLNKTEMICSTCMYGNGD